MKKLLLLLLISLISLICCTGGYKRFSGIEKGDRVLYQTTKGGWYGKYGEAPTWFLKDSLFSITFVKESGYRHVAREVTILKNKIDKIDKHPQQLPMPVLRY